MDKTMNAVLKWIFQLHKESDAVSFHQLLFDLDLWHLWTTSHESWKDLISFQGETLSQTVAAMHLYLLILFQCALISPDSLPKPNWEACTESLWSPWTDTCAGRLSLGWSKLELSWEPGNWQWTVPATESWESSQGNGVCPLNHYDLGCNAAATHSWFFAYMLLLGLVHSSNSDLPAKKEVALWP